MEEETSMTESSGSSFNSSDKTPIIPDQLTNAATTNNKNTWTIPNIILSILTVIAILSYSLGITLSTSASAPVGSDIYSVVFVAVTVQALVMVPVCLIVKLTKLQAVPLYHRDFWVVVVCGICNLGTILLSMYSGEPHRTPPHMQVVLFSCQIPFTAVLRKLLTKQGISWKRGVCIGVAVLGILTGSLPQEIANHKDEANKDASGLSAADVLWPCTYLFSQLICSAVFVLIEKMFVLRVLYPFAATFHVSVITLICAYVMFWTDLIPGIATASSVSELNDHLQVAWQCLFNHGDCADLSAYIWTVAFGCSMYLFLGILTVYYSDGAIFLSLLTALTLPLGIVFWSLFKDNDGLLEYSPRFTLHSLWAFLGLAIIIIATGFYEFFTHKEKKQQYIEH